jgi:hypothetical protein
MFHNLRKLESSFIKLEAAEELNSALLKRNKSLESEKSSDNLLILQKDALINKLENNPISMNSSEIKIVELTESLTNMNISFNDLRKETIENESLRNGFRIRLQESKDNISNVKFELEKILNLLNSPENIHENTKIAEMIELIRNMIKVKQDKLSEFTSYL